MRFATLLLAGCSFSGPAVTGDGHLASDGVVAGDGVVSGDATGDGGLNPIVPPGGVPMAMTVWLAGDDALHDVNEQLTSWPDRGPNHIDLAVDYTRTVPIFNPATTTTAATVKFSNGRLARAAGLWQQGTPITDLTMVVVAKDLTSTAPEWLLYSGTSGADRVSVARSFQSSSPTRWDVDVTTNNRDSSSQPDSKAVVMTYVASVATAVNGANHRELYVNGSATGGSAFAAYTGTGKPFEVGDHDDGASGDSSKSPYDGYLGEIFIASSIPSSTAALEQLETYFGLRYGITLGHAYRDATGTIVWDTGTIYDNRVAGLAVDPAARLHILGASATDGFDLLRIEATTLPVGAHAYLISGDDNGTVTFASNQLKRTWRVLGGAWGTPVTIDLAGPGSTSTTAIPASGSNTYSLKIGTDATFSNPMTVPLVVNGNNRLTATVTFAATSYFTVTAQ